MPKQPAVRVSYYNRHRKSILARLNRRYRKDAAFRKAAKQASKRRYHKDPEYREMTIERAKQRYRRLKRRRPKAGSSRR